MKKINKFSYVLKAVARNKNQSGWLKVIFLIIGVKGLYSITGSWALTLYSFLATFVLFAGGIVLIITNSSEEYFSKYKKAIENNTSVPDSTALTIFIVSFITILCIVVSLIVLKNNNFYA